MTVAAVNEALHLLGFSGQVEYDEVGFYYQPANGRQPNGQHFSTPAGLLAFAQGTECEGFLVNGCWQSLPPVW